MKKILILFLLIIFNNVYSQNTCWTCLGKGKITKRDWIACCNCKNWSSSYKSKVPCHVCKDNRGHYTNYYTIVCKTCKGTGHDEELKEIAKNYQSAIAEENRKKIEHKKKLEVDYLYSNIFLQEKLSERYVNVAIPTKDELKNILLKTHKVSNINNWIFESLDEFKSFTVENNLISSKDVLNITAKVVVVDIESSQQHKWDLLFIFYFNELSNKWNFDSVFAL